MSAGAQVDPQAQVWFGVVVIVVAEVGLVTPPVGLNVYVVSAYSKIPVKDIFIGVTPPEADPVAFRCDYVSGPAPATLAPATEPQLFTAASATAPPTPDAPTLLDVTLAALAGTGAPAHQIWLPPLTRSPELADLEGAREPWTATIGLVDRVAEQRRTPWRVDLSGADGNVAYTELVPEIAQEPDYTKALAAVQ